MAIVTGKAHVGSEDQRAIGGTSAFFRYEPIITPDQLVSRFLFGIPLVAVLPDPVTRVRAQMTPDMLKDFINRAIVQVETEVGIYITPVRKKMRLPFDRNDYRSLGYFRLPDAPILSVESLNVTTTDSQVVYTVPPEWIDPGQFHKGQVNLIPLAPAGLGGGVLPSMDAGGAAFIAILGQSPWVPSYWMIVYVTGFEDGHVPVGMNELIGMQAAIFVLDQIQATNRVANYSLGVDSASQSMQTGGTQVYATIIEGLEKRKQVLIGKWKAKFFKKIFTEQL